MIALPPPTPAVAERILRQLFGSVTGPFAFRLWNGQEVRLGQGEPACTAVIKTPETFLRLLRDPSPGNFAEAYVDSAIDLEGDLFAVMDVANQAEEIRIGPKQKLSILFALLRGRA